jgi:hypothetical protein
MKRFFFAIAAFLPAIAFAQNAQPFTIKAKLTNIKGPATAYLVYYLGANSVTDSATVNNGEFKFDGVVMDPVNASLFIDHKNLGFENMLPRISRMAAHPKQPMALVFPGERGPSN